MIRAGVRAGVIAAAAVSCGAIGACSAPVHEEPVSTVDTLQGGVDVRSPQLDAVGALLLDAPSKPRQSFCTGTLVSPTTVLTAKHSAQTRGSDGQLKPVTDLGTVYFGVGSDAGSPRKVVKALHAEVVEGSAGLLGVVPDVAIYTLAEPLSDVTPLSVASASLGAEDIGQSFVAIGYGIQNAEGDTGRRTAGNVTLTLLDGAPRKAAYGSFDAFKKAVAEAVAATEGRPLTPEEEAALPAIFEDPLIENYEAYFGARDGDVQGCSGDSGGPLLRKVGARLHIFGIASWVPRQGPTSPLCALGMTYAIFGPHTLPLLRKAECGGEPVEGRCDGTTVVRCVPPNEGGPRVTRTRCDELGLVCAVANGSAGCEDLAATRPTE